MKNSKKKSSSKSYKLANSLNKVRVLHSIFYIGYQFFFPFTGFFRFFWIHKKNRVNAIYKSFHQIKGITLFSPLAAAAICPSTERKSASFTSNPSFLRSSTTFFGAFSSENNFSLPLEDNIFFLFNQLGGVVKSGEYRIFGESGEVILNNLVWRYSCSQQIKNLPYHDSGSFESWFPMTDFALNYNVLIEFDSHKHNYSIVLFKPFVQSVKDIIDTGFSIKTDYCKRLDGIDKSSAKSAGAAA